jgi:hypothetical protein
MIETISYERPTPKIYPGGKQLGKYAKCEMEDLRSGIDFNEFSSAVVYTCRHFWSAVWSTYSRGPTSFDRFSGFVDGMISRCVKPI